MSEVAPRRNLLLPVLVVLAIGALGTFLHFRLDHLERRVEELSTAQADATRVLKLIRLEAESEGQGIAAILEQIRTWAPDLANAATPDPRARWLEQRLEEALDAIDALGPSVYPAIVEALERASQVPQPEDELRKWLLRAAERADPARGRALYVAVLRGTRMNPSARLRFLAYDDLARMDAEMAAEVLAQILQIESAQGITRQVPPELAPEYERVIGTNQFPQFFNFIGRFAASGHPDAENILLMILGRAEHDRMTYQATIKELGAMRSVAAVDRIKELYERPPGRDFNPIFRTTCLQAIADIQGARACEWFQEQLRTASEPLVVTKLQDLVKTLCP